MTNQSFISRIVEYVLKLTKPSYMSSLDGINKFLGDKLKSGDKSLKSIFKTVDFNGRKLITIGNKVKSSKSILFLHGGAYVNPINFQHTLFCYMLSKVLDAYIVIPDYPLAPKYNYEPAFELLTDLYNTFEFDIVVGDSAGGGLALSFCQYLTKIKLNQPEQIIVFSPWVDISMSGQYDGSNDPILDYVGLCEIGKYWAGNVDVKDYRVSPLFGNNSGLAKTLIFTGSNEIFYHDIKKYYENLISEGVDARLIVGEGLFHIYPMFPIPEAVNAIKEIKKELIN